MPSEAIGAFSPADARMILDAVRFLKSSGVLLNDGKKKPAVVPPPRMIYFKNDSGETCPAFSIMQVTGTEEVGGQNYLTIDKYSESVFGQLLINGYREVETDGLGVAQPGPIYRIQGDGSTVTNGYLWGASNGSWTATDNGGPYLASGEDDVETDVIVASLDLASGYVATATTDITAADGDVLGDGEVSLRPIGASWTASPQQTGVAVGSILSDTISNGAKLVLVRSTNGRLIVVSEDCG